MAEDVDDNDPADELTIAPKKAFFIIVKAREFDEEVAPTDPDSGSNPTDDREVDVLESQARRSDAGRARGLRLWA